MSGALVIGAGSCIIEAILNQLRAIPGVADRVDLHLSQVVQGGRAILPPDLLSRCTLLIEEAAPWQGSGTLSAAEREALPSGSVTIQVPTLHFNSLWPLMTEDPRNIPEPGFPYGRIPFPFGDRLALQIVRTEPDPTTRRAQYDAIDMAKAINLTRSHELEARNWFARERGCDARAAAFIFGYFRQKRLFYTHNHPTGELMYFVLAQLHTHPALRDLVKLPYDQALRHARHWADTSNVFGGEEAPIHPAVAEYFQLEWWRPDMTYAWRDRHWTFNAWMDFYLAHDPPGWGNPHGEAASAAPAASAPPAPTTTPAPGREVPFGPYLAAMPLGAVMTARGSLRPEITIRRSEFVTSADPAAFAGAPNGALLHDAGMRSYAAPPVLVGVLRHGSLLGTTGAILADGQVVGDTVRDLAPGAAIARVEPGRLELRPGLTERHQAGHLLAGFGARWTDPAHWLLTSVPRLAAFLELRRQMPALRLALPRFAAGSFQADSLAALGIGPDDVITIADTEILACDELVTTSAFDLWRIAPFVREAAIRLGAALPAASTAERVFLDRPTGSPALAERDTVLGWMRAQGFTILDADATTLAMQAAAAQGASLVVGLHGWPLANLLFARPGTVAIELCSAATAQPLFWTVASVAGLRYGYVLGTDLPPADGTGARMALDLDRLGHALARMASQHRVPV